MSLYKNGGLVGSRNVATGVSASGIWRRNEQLLFKQEDSWPNAIVLRTGNTTTGGGSVSTTQKKFGTYSVEPSNTRFTTVGHTDTNFTLEGWFYTPGSFSAYSFAVWGASTGSFGMSLYNNNIMTLSQTDGSNQDFSLGISLSANTWYHIALTRSGNTVRLFINGTQRGGDKTFTGTLIGSGHSIKIGTSSLGGSCPYADEIRLSNTVRYQGTSAEPTLAFVNDEQTICLLHCEEFPLVDDTTTYTPPAADPNFADVVFLAGFESSMIDDTGRHTLNQSGTGTFNTATKKYGQYSRYMASGANYITIGNTATGSDSDFMFGTGDWTVEMWVYITGTFSGNINLFSLNGNRNDVSGGPSVLAGSGGDAGGWELAWYENTAAGFQSSSASLAYNTWHHVGACRTGGRVYYAINGAVEDKIASTKNYNDVQGSYGGASIKYGPYQETGFNAYFDEIRVTKGVARYTSSYTVPTTRFARS